MSRGFQSNSRDYIHGFPRGGDYDKHIERIIDHASNLFSESQYQLPQICTPSTSHWNNEGDSGELSQIGDDLTLYGGLGGLGKPECCSHDI